MLTSLRLKDWKSFGEGPALPFGRVTFLVGPNGSGKSNLIDALKFLQGVALDLPVGEVLRGRYEGQREVWPGIRGYAAEAVRHGQHEIDIYARWSDGHYFGVKAMMGAGPLGRGAHERLFQDVTSDLGLPVERRERERRLREQIFLDIIPLRMRDYRPEGASQLGVNAENVSPMLYQLEQREPAQVQNVVDWLSELCAPAIEAIDFDRTQLGEVMMFLVERGGAKISARSASDGTLRFLGLLVALLTVPEGSMVLVEEPDVGLHPSRIHLLASLIEDTAKHRSLQVIATTHSPTLLAHLSDEALADVLAFGRSPDDGTTIGRRVGELEHFATLRDSRNLEHLVSTGWLERAL